jgi:hypothetical protein
MILHPEHSILISKAANWSLKWQSFSASHPKWNGNIVKKRG